MRHISQRRDFKVIQGSIPVHVSSDDSFHTQWLCEEPCMRRRELRKWCTRRSSLRERRMARGIDSGGRRINGLIPFRWGRISTGSYGCGSTIYRALLIGWREYMPIEWRITRWSSDHLCVWRDGSCWWHCCRHRIRRFFRIRNLVRSHGEYSDVCTLTASAEYDEYDVPPLMV